MSFTAGEDGTLVVATSSCLRRAPSRFVLASRPYLSSSCRLQSALGWTLCSDQRGGALAAGVSPFWAAMAGLVAMLPAPSCMRSHVAPGATRLSSGSVQLCRARWVRAPAR